jgi:hypothetical protein
MTRLSFALRARGEFGQLPPKDVLCAIAGEVSGLGGGLVLVPDRF